MNGIEILLPSSDKKDLVQYYLTTNLQTKLLFISLSSKPRSIEKVYLHNQLIKDNIARYFKKIDSIIVPLSNQVFMGIFRNNSTDFFT